jgi:hypothetical protein
MDKYIYGRGRGYIVIRLIISLSYTYLCKHIDIHVILKLINFDICSDTLFFTGVE